MFFNNLKYLVFFLLTLSLFFDVQASKNLQLENDSIKKGKKNSIFFAFFVESGLMFDVSNMSSIFKEKKAGRKVILDSQYQGYEIKVAISSNIATKYHSLYRYPKYGIGFYFGNFNNKNIGFPVAMFGWIEVPFTHKRPKQKVSFGYGAEIGIAWNFNPYNADRNPTNVFLGSRENYILGAYFYSDFHINPHLVIGINAGLRHFSNGGWEQPNIGINILSGAVSLKYQINQPLQLPERLVVSKVKPCWKWGLKFGFGRKQNDIGTPFYHKVVIGGNILRQISNKYCIGIGLENTFSFGRKDNGTIRTAWRDRVSPAAVGCWEWILSSKVVIPMEIGIYLLPKNLVNGEKYQTFARIGIRYFIIPHFWIGGTAKGHSIVTHTVADFSELGFGYEK